MLQLLRVNDETHSIMCVKCFIKRKFAPTYIEEMIHAPENGMQCINCLKVYQAPKKKGPLYQSEKAVALRKSNIIKIAQRLYQIEDICQPYEDLDFITMRVSSCKNGDEIVLTVPCMKEFQVRLK